MQKFKHYNTIAVLIKWLLIVQNTVQVLQVSNISMVPSYLLSLLCLTSSALVLLFPPSSVRFSCLCASLNVTCSQTNTTCTDLIHLLHRFICAPATFRTEFVQSAARKRRRRSIDVISGGRVRINLT